MTTTTTETRLLLKVADAAYMIGVSPNSLKAMIKRGEIRVNRKFRHILVPVAELEKFARS